MIEVCDLCRERDVNHYSRMKTFGGAKLYMHCERCFTHRTKQRLWTVYFDATSLEDYRVKLLRWEL